MHGCSLELNDHKLKVKELQLEIQEKSDSIASLNETIDSFNVRFIVV